MLVAPRSSNVRGDAKRVKLPELEFRLQPADVSRLRRRAQPASRLKAELQREEAELQRSELVLLSWFQDDRFG
jgi:hypothetical protein